MTVLDLVGVAWSCSLRWLARSLIMGEGVVVRPDQVSLGVLVSAVPRDAVDVAVARYGVGAKRSDGKLPAHVTAYLTMAMCLFAEDDYTEVATKVTGSLSRWGCWDAGWSVPTASGISQARKRLGPKVLAEVFEQVAAPVATVSTRGAWQRSSTRSDVSCISGPSRCEFFRAARCRAGPMRRRAPA